MPHNNPLSSNELKMDRFSTATPKARDIIKENWDRLDNNAKDILKNADRIEWHDGEIHATKSKMLITFNI